MPPTAADWVGHSLDHDRYLVTARLGAGGMGFVYKATDRRLGCDVVIKVPRAEMLADTHGAPAFDTLDALLKASDIITIASPPSSHAANARLAARLNGRMRPANSAHTRTCSAPIACPSGVSGKG